MNQNFKNVSPKNLLVFTNMIKKSLKSIMFVFLSFTVNSQIIDLDHLDGEVYLKVKNLKINPTNKTSSAVNIAEELPFLSKNTSIKVSSVEHSFHFSKNQNLQKIYRIKIDNPEQIKTFINQLSKDVEVEYVERVPLNKIIYTPNDPAFASSQYGLTKISAPQAWEVSKGNANMIVAVVDNAIETNHPDLAANMLPGRDVADQDNDPNPPNSSFDHGTHVSGIAGAVTNNGIGMASIGHNKVKILPVKATNNTASSSQITHAYEGVAWAAANGANIINMSWGGGSFSITNQAVMDDAYARGCILIAAAGNNSSTTQFYPAAYNKVVSVVSTSENDAKSSFSTYGSWVDICAPGSNIYSAVPFGQYSIFNGTSMASPLVASVFAYIWSVNPNLTQIELETLIKANCDNINAQNPGLSGLLGAGRINAYRTVMQACPNQTPVSITPSTTQVLCNASSQLLTVTSIENSNYQWIKDGVFVGSNENTFLATETGSYGATVQLSNGCPTVANPVKVTIFPNVISITTNKAPVVCGADSVVLNVPYLHGNITYLWKKDGQAIGLDTNRYVARDAGNYTVEISSVNPNCSVISETITVSKIEYDPIITPNTSPRVLCNGQSLSISVPPLAGASFQWQRDNNFVGSNLESYNAQISGLYSVKIIKNSCTFLGSGQVRLSVLPNSLTITSNRSTSICLGQSVILSATNLEGVSYEWKKNGVLITGETTSSYTANAAGNYSVTMLNSTNCSISSSPIAVSFLNENISISSPNTLSCVINPILITATSSTNATYQWFKNNTLISSENNSTLSANSSGIYKTIATKNGCTSASNLITLNFPTTQTDVATTQNGMINGTIITPVSALANNNCPSENVKTFAYSGGTIGYDGGNRSGSYPTLNTVNLSNTSRFTVSVTFDKKSGGNATTCSSPTLGGSPYNGEIQFKLRSPSGTLITLVSGRFGGSYTGVVTIIFSDSAPAIVNGSTPTSGSFAPQELLSTLLSENLNGIWTLEPEDLAGGDPLCVSGFGMTFNQNNFDSPPVINWYDAATGGNLVGTGSTFTPTSFTGNKTYYAEALCNTYCQSARVAATFLNVTMETVKAGNWNDPTVWSLNRVPTFTDNIIIKHDVEVSGSGNAKSITFNSGTITYAENAQLILAGN